MCKKDIAYSNKLLILFMGLFWGLASNNCYAKNIKILFMLDKFPWYTKSIIVNQMNFLIEHGYDVFIYARTVQRSDFVEPEVNKYNLLRRTYYEKLPTDLHTYDIIMCQYGYEGKRFINFVKAHNIKAKFVTCIRGGDITSEKEIANHAYDELFKYGDLFLPVCGYFKYKLMLLGCDFEKIKVIHSAIDCSKFKFRERKLKSDKKIRIVSVNRLNKEKATDYVIKAVARLLNKGRKIEYLIVGDGSNRKELEKLISSLGVKKHIKLLGWLPQDKIASVLDSADIFVLPSVTPARGSQEGIPNALKEAMSMGLPVIGSFHSGIPELIENGVSGFLVPERDIDSLEKKLNYLIKHPEIWSEMGRHGRLKIEQEFENSIVNQELVKTLNNLFTKN